MIPILSKFTFYLIYYCRLLLKDLLFFNLLYYSVLKDYQTTINI